jgi:hypothetical protein
MLFETRVRLDVIVEEESLGNLWKLSGMPLIIFNDISKYYIMILKALKYYK